MAEFKDISLFEEVTPTYANAANMWVQVSATEKVNLAAVAAMAKDIPLEGFTPAAYATMPKATDTLLQAIQKLGIVGRYPDNVDHYNKVRFIASFDYGADWTMHGCGFVFSYYNQANEAYTGAVLWAMIGEQPSSNNWRMITASKLPSTVFEQLPSVDPTAFKSLFNTIITKDTDQANECGVSITPMGNLFGGQLRVISNLTAAGFISMIRAMGKAPTPTSFSSLVILATRIAPVFNIASVGSNVLKCEGFDDIVKPGATNVCITAQLVSNGPLSSDPYYILLNAAKYEAGS